MFHKTESANITYLLFFLFSFFFCLIEENFNSIVSLMSLWLQILIVIEYEFNILKILVYWIFYMITQNPARCARKKRKTVLTSALKKKASWTIDSSSSLQKVSICSAVIIIIIVSFLFSIVNWMSLCMALVYSRNWSTVSVYQHVIIQWRYHVNILPFVLKVIHEWSQAILMRFGWFHLQSLLGNL